jgi:hypothetical protein
MHRKPDGAGAVEAEHRRSGRCEVQHVDTSESCNQPFLTSATFRNAAAMPVCLFDRSQLTLAALEGIVTLFSMAAGYLWVSVDSWCQTPFLFIHSTPAEVM